MRHYKKGRKLGTDASHTKAMKKSLCVALFTNDRIKTVEARAKEILPRWTALSPGQSVATCILAAWLLPPWATRNLFAKCLKRSSKASLKIAKVVIPAL